MNDKSDAGCPVLCGFCKGWVPQRITFTRNSREAAQECSPRRKPWVDVESKPAPPGRKINR
jgi:hypothetical protein